MKSWFQKPIHNSRFELFKSREHEMELVKKFQGVNYVNDSRSTNINSTWNAITSYNSPIIWIAGGATKNTDYNLLLNYVKNIKALICIGSDNTKLHNTFGKKIMCIINASDMDHAVLAAARLSEKGDTVLLSPGCPSFDKYENFEHRGIQFRKSVKSLYMNT